MSIFLGSLPLPILFTCCFYRSLWSDILSWIAYTFSSFRMSSFLNKSLLAQSLISLKKSNSFWLYFSVSLFGFITLLYTTFRCPNVLHRISLPSLTTGCRPHNVILSVLQRQYPFSYVLWYREIVRVFCIFRKPVMFRRPVVTNLSETCALTTRKKTLCNEGRKIFRKYMNQLWKMECVEYGKIMSYSRSIENLEY